MALPDQPMPNPQVIQNNMVQAAGTMNQGLTATENAFLTEAEKELRLKQRGIV